MKGLLPFGALALLACSPSASAVPRKVASLKLCTDELLLMLGDPRQIASVTHLSQSPHETPVWKSARAYRKNDGTMLSVAPLRPDLILDMSGGSRDAERIARRLGIRLLNLPYPQTLEDMKAMIRTTAQALGRPGAGRAVLDRISALERTAPKVPVDTIWLGGGGRTVASTGIAANWMRLAGLAQRPVEQDRVSLEQLLVSPPAILLRSDYRSGQYSGEQRWLSHPLAKGVRGSRRIVTDGRPWTCMGPPMISEIMRLRAQVRR